MPNEQEQYMQDEFAELQNPPPDVCQYPKGRTEHAQYVCGPATGSRVVAHCRKYGVDLYLRAEDLGVQESELMDRCLTGETHCPISNA